MSSVSRSAAAPTATIMDLEMESSMGSMMMEQSATSVRSALPTGAPAAGAGAGAGFAALEEAFPPCAMDCIMQYATPEAACAASNAIMTCGESACTGPDLTRFEALLTELAPLCGVVAGSAEGTASAGAPRSAGNAAATGTASAAVKTNGTKAAGNSAAATGTATKAATTAAKKDSSASMMNVFGLFASAVALLML